MNHLRPSAVILTLMLVFPALGISAVSAQPQMVEVIVGFTSENQARQAVENAGGRVIRTYTLIPALLATIPENAIEGLQRNPNVRYVHLNGQVEAVGQVTPWGVERVKAPLVWSKTTGSGVKLAVLDTGLGPHEDLSVAGGTNTIGGTSYDDDNGHGTHVAGSAGALNNDLGVVGVAYAVSVYSVKVLNKDGSGTVDSVVLGIQWSVGNGMRIISMSLGTKFHYDALKEAVDASYSAGLLNVAAAGNEGNPRGSGSNVIYPAKYESVVAVGATDKDDKRAWFSSTGPELELMAPGVSILSTYLDNTYKELSGTSMATPHVSGVAALVWAKNTGLTNAQLRKILQDTATDLGDAGKDNKYGYGLVNAEKAVAAATPQESHDVAVTSITAPSAINKGEVAAISVKVANEGTFEETFTVTLTDKTDSVQIGSQTVTLAAGSSTTLTFSWDTSSSSLGDHILEAVASTVSGETDTGDNVKTALVKVKPLTVEVVEPSDGATVKGTITIKAKVSSTVSVSSVEYAIDSGSFAPMSFNADTGLWEASRDTTTVADGSHTITVKASNSYGSDQKTIGVTVANTVKQLSVSVNTDKSSYTMGEWVYITVKVTHDTNPISDASVHVELTTASGRVYAGDGSTDSNGEVTFTFKIKKPDGTGTYSVTPTASKAGYESGSGSTTFKVT